MTDGHSSAAAGAASPSAGTASRWSDDAFLDRLRASVDDRADRALSDLRREGVTAADTGRFFAAMAAEPGTQGGQRPDELPTAIAAFFADTEAVQLEMQPDIDEERMRRGKELFHRYTAQACLVMLAASLPAGYSAPCLSRVLTVSDDGSGLPDAPSESGLRNARRRAADLGGSLELSPGSPRGTTLVWRVPLG